MKKKLIYIFMLFIFILLFSCNHDEKIDGLKPHEILVVTLEIEDNTEFNKITLISTDGTDTITIDPIKNKKRYKLKTPQIGEGMYKICVYTTTDTLCSKNNYIEGGYRPKLRLINHEFEQVKWF